MTFPSFKSPKHDGSLQLATVLFTPVFCSFVRFSPPGLRQDRASENSCAVGGDVAHKVRGLHINGLAF